MARNAESVIRVDTICDDVGQERLRAADERLAPAASAARAEVTQESQASLARVQVVQERRSKDMNEAFVVNNAENVKPPSRGIAARCHRGEQSNRVPAPD